MKAILTTLRINKYQNLGKIINLSKYLNQEIAKSDSDFICLIDDKNTPVKLKDSCREIMQMALQKNPGAGMVYADYENVTDGNVQEIHLLKYHLGRVRDNQDYGKVFLFRKSILEQVGGFSEKLKHNYLYDIRLKLSEVSEIVHLANKSVGSL